MADGRVMIAWHCLAKSAALSISGVWRGQDYHLLNRLINTTYIPGSGLQGGRVPSLASALNKNALPCTECL